MSGQRGCAETQSEEDGEEEDEEEEEERRDADGGEEEKEEDDKFFSTSRCPTGDLREKAEQPLAEGRQTADNAGKRWAGPKRQPLEELQSGPHLRPPTLPKSVVWNLANSY